MTQAQAPALKPCQCFDMCGQDADVYTGRAMPCELMQMRFDMQNKAMSLRQALNGYLSACDACHHCQSSPAYEKLRAWLKMAPLEAIDSAKE